MAETVDADSNSDSEPEGTPKKPLLKRRRFFADSAVPAVPVYSEKVQNSLQLFSDSLKLPAQIPELSSTSQVLSVSDDEEEAPAKHAEEEKRCKDLSPSSPSPPPPQPRKTHCEPRVCNQLLRNLTSTLSAAQKSLQEAASGDDVILIDAPGPSEPEKLVLKIRCRTDLYRVSIQMTDPLQRVVEHMGQMLKVHPNRILLLLRDQELAADATPARLGLGVADIIDCIVETTSGESADVGNLQLRVQGKDKSSQMEITVRKGEPLETLMNHYRQAQGLGRCKLVFHFDGQRLMENWTPEDLGMESGDVIEVWS